MGDAGTVAAERVAQARAGSVRATARLLSMAENGGARAATVSQALRGLPRSAHVVGITGAPGAGKSTLTAGLLRVLRDQDHKVAVLAVDPSSPFTGGALLGDRVRMVDFATDPDVFIRSLSSRGHLGGLSAGTPAAVDLMSALGFDTVIVETVGVGQSEIDVMNLADTVAVVLAPGMGDAIQAAKAGIMEIADILVVNKADHEGARTTVREIKAMLMLAGLRRVHTRERIRTDGNPDGSRDAQHSKADWQIPVISTVAENGSGVTDLADALQQHHDHLARTGDLALRRGRRASAAVEAIVVEQLRRELKGTEGQAELAKVAKDVIGGSGDTYAAAQRVTRWLRRR